jgi:hypothetical protein
LQGCASGGAHTEKQFQTLRDELTLTQTALDRIEERLAAIEVERVRGERAQADSVRDSVTRPQLKVVRVEPDAADAERVQEQAPVAGKPPAADDYADADAARPMISGEGTRLQAKDPGAGRDDQAKVTRGSSPQ